MNKRQRPRATGIGSVAIFGLMFCLLQTAPVAAQIANGSFETGDYRGWDNTDPANFGLWALGKNGDVLPAQVNTRHFRTSEDNCSNVGTSTQFRAGRMRALASTDGQFVAYQLQRAPQTYRMMQTVSLDPAVTTLDWDMQYENVHGTFIPGVQDIQVTIRDTSDVVLETVFQTQTFNDPPSTAMMTPYSVDISSHAGTTVRISFDLNVSGDNDGQAPFNGLEVIFDNIRTPGVPGDYDGDGFLDPADNCDEVPNGAAPNVQGDYDEDGVGDLCDNCPQDANPGQEDDDEDGVGNACESQSYRRGDLYALSTTFPTGDTCYSVYEPGIIKFDPFTGAHHFHAVLPPSFTNFHMHYDPHRDKIVAKQANAVSSFLLIDAQGAITTLPIDWGGNNQITLWVPTGDGKIYMVHNSAPPVFGYMDEFDQFHDLLDFDGETPLRIDFGHTNGEELIYDLQTNSLFLFDAAGGQTDVYKIPLNADGSGLAAPVVPETHNYYFSSADTPFGISAGPRGQIYLKLDVNASLAGTLMGLIDPVTLEFANYADVAGPSTAGSTVGTYSSLRKGVLAIQEGTSTAYASLRTFIETPSPFFEPQPGNVLSTVETRSHSSGITQLLSIGDTVNRTFRLTLEMDDFDDGDVIYGAAGETVRVFGTAFLNPSVPGVTAWDLSLRGEGANVAFGLDPCGTSCASELVYFGGATQVLSNDQEVVDPLLTPTDGPLFGLAEQGPGIVDQVTWDGNVILGTARVKVLRFYVDITVPDSLVGEEVKIFFGDGLRGSGETVFNSVVIDGETVTSDQGIFLGETRFTIRNAEPIELLSECTVQPFLAMPPDPVKVFRFVPDPAKFLRLRLTDVSADPSDHANALYATQVSPGLPYIPGKFDLASDKRFEQDQRLAIFSLRQDSFGMTSLPVFVEVRSTSFGRPADLNSLALEVKEKEVVIESLSATLSGQGGSGIVRARVRGAGFQDGMTFELDPSFVVQSPIVATETTIISSRRAEVAFEIQGQPLGSYEARVRLPNDAEDVLEDAFELTNGNLGSVVKFRMHGASAYRYNRESSLTLEWENVGDVAVPAPLVKIVGPPGTLLRLPRETQFHTDEMLVMAIHPDGVPGTLPAGARGEIPIIFRLQVCPPCPEGDDTCLPCAAEDPFCTLDCENVIQCFVMDGDAFVQWDTVDIGVPPIEWAALWPSLSQILGGTWQEFRQSLGDLSTRRSRLGKQGASVFELFRYAARQAKGLPSAALAGRVLENGSNTPVIGAEVLAKDVDGTTLSSAVTDEAGDFAIDWLENRSQVELAVVDQQILQTPTGNTLVTIPTIGDRYGFDLVVQASSGGGTAGCANCNESALPNQVMVPPAELFIPATELELRVVNSWDPNEKNGPGDLGSPVPVDQRLEYTIFFENVGVKDPQGDRTLGAPAQEIVITDVFDPTVFDLNTFEIMDVRLGNLPFQFAPLGNLGLELNSGVTSSLNSERLFGSHVFTVTTEFEDLGQIQQVEQEITIEWEVDAQTGLATWEFKSNAPHALVGVLPVNDLNGSGEGHISCSVAPLPNLDDGTSVENDALITFDINAPIPTQTWINVLTYDLPPEAPRFPQPVDGATGVPGGTVLQWEAPLATEYDVYFWKSNGIEPSQPTASSIPNAYFQTPSNLDDGDTYLWKVTARNFTLDMSAQEAQGPTWSFVASEPLPCPPDTPENFPDLVAPDDGAVGVPFVGTVLDWTPVAGVQSYNLYLWLDSQGEPEQPFASGFQSDEILIPIDLILGEEYSWRVEAVFHENCVKQSPPWSFTAVVTPFHRGDGDLDGTLTIADAVLTLQYLYLGIDNVSCFDALDTDDDGRINLLDVMLNLFHQFDGFPIPPPVSGVCGGDPTPNDTLGCAEAVSTCVSD